MLALIVGGLYLGGRVARPRRALDLPLAPDPRRLLRRHLALDHHRPAQARHRRAGHLRRPDRALRRPRAQGRPASTGPRSRWPPRCSPSSRPRARSACRSPARSSSSSSPSRSRRSSTCRATASPPSATSPRACRRWRCPRTGGASLDQLLLGAVAIFLVSFAAGIVTARSFGQRGGYPVDAEPRDAGLRRRQHRRRALRRPSRSPPRTRAPRSTPASAAARSSPAWWRPRRSSSPSSTCGRRWRSCRSRRSARS